MPGISIDRSKPLRENSNTGHNRWRPDIPPAIEIDENLEMTTNIATAADRTAAVVVAPPPLRLPQPPTGPARFPDFSPRDDMMNPRYLHAQAHQAALGRHLGDPDTTLVLGEVPIAWAAAFGRAGVRIPDLLVAFDVPTARILEQKGYAIRDIGKPPDLALEIASDSTSASDERDKWLDYARFGVTEYWLFDPDWGLRYEAGLIGWRLVNGIYRRIRIRRRGRGSERRYGYSAVLGLQVCWERGQLRWYDPVGGRYLDTYDSVSDARDAEAIARRYAETQRDDERAARLAAEAEIQRLLAEIARRDRSEG